MPYQGGQQLFLAGLGAACRGKDLLENQSGSQPTDRAAQRKKARHSGDQKRIFTFHVLRLTSGRKARPGQMASTGEF